MTITVHNENWRDQPVTFKVTNRHESELSYVEVLDVLFGPGQKTIDVLERFYSPQEKKESAG